MTMTTTCLSIKHIINFQRMPTFARYWDNYSCRSLGPDSYWYKKFDMNQDGRMDEFKDKEGIYLLFDANRE